MTWVISGETICLPYASKIEFTIKLDTDLTIISSFSQYIVDIVVPACSRETLGNAGFEQREVSKID